MQQKRILANLVVIKLREHSVEIFFQDEQNEYAARLKELESDKDVWAVYAYESVGLVYTRRKITDDMVERLRVFYDMRGRGLIPPTRDFLKRALMFMFSKEPA